MKGSFKQQLLSWKIVIQIALLWVIPIMFDIGNFWVVTNGTYVVSRDTVSPWVIDEYTVAASVLWLQHWLYVSMYMRVALMIELTFCSQNEKVK